MLLGVMVLFFIARVRVGERVRVRVRVIRTYSVCMLYEKSNSFVSFSIEIYARGRK